MNIWNLFGDWCLEFGVLLFMHKKFLKIAGTVAIFVLLGAGCFGGNSGTYTPGDGMPANLDQDYTFVDLNTPITFTVKSYLQQNVVSSTPGAVRVSFDRKPGSTGLIETVTFSTKTREALLSEKKPAGVCQNEIDPGCEKWDENVAAYNRAIQSGNFNGYYALGADKTTVNDIPFVVAVTYNPDNQLFQTKYTAYVNETRITFIDPASGGLEYGVPFQMDAKNRELVEKTAQDIASRKNISDPKNRARADELYQMVETIKIGN